MAYVTWCEMFSIKVPSIDEQHKKLINIVNTFHNELDRNLGHQTLFNTLNMLIKYTEEHFSYEEKIMETSDYPAEACNDHKAIHEKLVEEIFELNSRFNNNKKESLFGVELFMNKWLVRHILEEDKKLEPFCKDLIIL